MYKDWKKLTKDEREHLRVVAKVCTTEDLKGNFEKQRQMRKRTRMGHIYEPCWDCRRIAKKLGYPVDLEEAKA